MDDLTVVFKEIVESLKPFPVDFDRAWKWVGYSTKASALRALEEHFVAGEDFSTTKGKSIGGRRPDQYALTTDCFKEFCMMAGTDKGKEVRKYYLDIERQFIAALKGGRARVDIRRLLTDAVQESALNDTMHGWAYKTITDLIYRQALGMDARHFRTALGLGEKANVREHLTQTQAVAVARLEKLASSLLDMGAEYAQIKTILDTFGVPKIGKEKP